MKPRISKITTKKRRQNAENKQMFKNEQKRIQQTQTDNPKSQSKKQTQYKTKKLEGFKNQPTINIRPTPMSIIITRQLN